MKNETEKMYEKVAPLVDKMRAKYPTNIDGLEPALTSDIAEICVKIIKERDGQWEMAIGYALEPMCYETIRDALKVIEN